MSLISQFIYTTVSYFLRADELNSNINNKSYSNNFSEFTLVIYRGSREWSKEGDQSSWHRYPFFSNKIHFQDAKENEIITLNDVNTLLTSLCNNYMLTDRVKTY